MNEELFHPNCRASVLAKGPRWKNHIHHNLCKKEASDFLGSLSHPGTKACVLGMEVPASQCGSLNACFLPERTDVQEGVLELTTTRTGPQPLLERDRNVLSPGSTPGTQTAGAKALRLDWPE